MSPSTTFSIQQKSKDLTTFLNKVQPYKISLKIQFLIQERGKRNIISVSSMKKKEKTYIIPHRKKKHLIKNT